MARGPRRLALVAVLVGVWPGPPEEVLRSLPEGHRQRLGEDAAGHAECPASRREVRAAPRARVAAGPYAVDEALPRRHRPRVEPEADRHAGQDPVRGAGLGRALLD